MSSPQDEEFLEVLEDEPRSSSISFAGLLVGLVFGLMIGLFYSWQIDPIVVRNTAPSELTLEDKQHFVAAAALEYNTSRNLPLAVERLLEISPEENPFVLAADTTCAMIRSGQVTDLSDIVVVRNLRSIFEPQGVVAQCDVAAFNTPIPVTIIQPSATATFTPSITPVATKTPTRAIEPEPINTPIPRSTTQAGIAFREAFVEPFCNPDSSGIIEIYVRDENSLGMPGVPVEVTWGNRERQSFYTGLKPERGDDYADFEMESGETYRVTVRDEGQPSRELDAVVCDDEGTIASYRVVIQRVPPEDDES